MNLLFVTGSNSGFFNSMLVGLQSFAERLPGQRLLVCDYGLQPAALFVLTHGDALLRHGLCGRAANPIEGFQFVTLPG